MILTSMMSGLGNQLFEYANARAVALKNNTDLYVDLRWYQDKNISYDRYSADRMYLLDMFNVIYKKQTSPFRIKKDNLYNRILAKTFKNGYYFFKYYGDIKKYDKNFHNLGDNTYIACASHSYKNFEKYPDIINKELTLKKPLNRLNSNMLNIINHSENSVAIHFRRGDKVYNEAIAKIHGSCDLSYYKQALNILEHRINSQLTLFVFSDDIEWTKTHFKTNHQTFFIDFNKKEEDAVFDLELMKNCQNHIIANSSFSLWGRYLRTGGGATASHQVSIAKL